MNETEISANNGTGNILQSTYVFTHSLVTSKCVNALEYPSQIMYIYVLDVKTTDKLYRLITLLDIRE